MLQTVARDLRLGVRVIGCPIIREPDGLAMSSRNAYLTAEQRSDALALSRALQSARGLWDGGVREPERLRAAMREGTTAPGVVLEYASAADPITLVELIGPAERMVLSIAARVGRARLIDNVLLGMDLSDLS